MRIYCPKCEAANDEDAVACSLCGHQLVESSKKPPAPDPPVKRKARRLPSCRECGHTVARAAKTCPDCGVARPGLSKMTQIVTTVVAGACIITVVLVCSGVFNTGPPKEPEEGSRTTMACVMIQDLVEPRLVSPATADWPWTCDKVTYLGDGRYRVLTYVDAQNRFGGLIRSNIDAVVKYVGDDLWKLESLKME